MTKRDHAPGYVPNDSYSQEDWDEVSDNPELTREQLRKAVPLADVAPELAAALRRGRGAQKAPTKKLVSLRLDQRVIDHFKATGEGWQTRINEVLLKAAGL
jgi:uncharacterized protein (DUF4415 family)